MAIKQLVKTYLPEAEQEKAHDDMLRVFTEIIGKETTSGELKEELAASLAGFVATPEHIERAKLWIEKKAVHTEDEKLLYEPKNTFDFLSGLIFVLHSFASVSKDYKDETLNSILGDD